jgi:hypothetical protein
VNQLIPQRIQPAQNNGQTLKSVLLSERAMRRAFTAIENFFHFVFIDIPILVVPKRLKNVLVVNQHAYCPRVFLQLGYRFRLDSKVGKIKPDIVLRSRKVAIFVHGCYWHQHEGCKLAYSDRDYIEKWK